MRGKCLLPASVVLCAALTLAGCQQSAREVSYAREVSPILERHCKSCHMPGQAGYVVSGFELRDYETLMNVCPLDLG